MGPLTGREHVENVWNLINIFCNSGKTNQGRASCWFGRACCEQHAYWVSNSFCKETPSNKKEHNTLNKLPAPWSIVINVMPVCTLFPSKLMLYWKWREVFIIVNLFNPTLGCQPTWHLTLRREVPHPHSKCGPPLFNFFYNHIPFFTAAAWIIIGTGLMATSHMRQEPWPWNCESPIERVQRPSQHTANIM